ncbi:MAG: hypothetical protein AAFR44_06075, partial [Pseudomonadota bacterium]
GDSFSRIWNSNRDVLESWTNLNVSAGIYNNSNGLSVEVFGKNITDEEAEAAFRVVMEGLDAEMVSGAQDDAIWLVPGYEPNRLAQGAIATATASPAPVSYPSTSQMGLMHTSLGNELPSFFTGDRDAEATLAAIEDAYITAAKEAGLIE